MIAVPEANEPIMHVIMILRLLLLADISSLRQGGMIVVPEANEPVAYHGAVIAARDDGVKAIDIQRHGRAVKAQTSVAPDPGVNPLLCWCHAPPHVARCERRRGGHKGGRTPLILVRVPIGVIAGPGEALTGVVPCG